MTKIGFIGTGHMGGSIALALKDAPYTLYLNNRTESKAKVLKEQIPSAILASQKTIMESCDLVFLGVKPKDVKDVLMGLRDYGGGAVIVSMAAGVYLKDMEPLLPNRFIRIMPNTPVLYHSGVTLVSYGRGVDESTKRLLKEILQVTGAYLEIEEEQMDSLGVLTGSAPAYLDYFLDALIKATVNQGYDEETATTLTLKMAEGVIKLALESKTPPQELGKAICTPGGSSIEGVNVLLQRDLYQNVSDAYQATLNKNKKMVG